jgi:hypothetical protein
LRCADDFKKPFGAGRRERRHVVVDRGFEWQLSFPLRMLRCHGADAVERKDDLKVDWLLGP